jgi:phage FluMu protein gp41
MEKESTCMPRTNMKSEALFAQYAAMGPERSLAKLAELLGKPPSYKRQLERMSSENSWQARARQYDAARAEEERRERDKERRERMAKWEEERERMDMEHALLGRTHALRAAKQIQDLIEAKRFGSQAAVQLLKISTDLERVARGADTSSTRVQVHEEKRAEIITFDITKLSDEQLARLEDIADELEGKESEQRDAE